MHGWSREVRVLGDPEAVFRQMAASPQGDAWTLVRRPLLLAFAMGLTLSLDSSGRLSLRTVVDGMTSFAFLPVAEVLAVGVVYLRGDRRVPFARVVDAFFVSNAPWLFWILAFCLWRIPRTGLQNSASSSTLTAVVVGSLIVPACWALYLDRHFFRIVLPRPSRSVWRDLVTERAVGWILAIGWFYGIALWADAVALVNR